MTMQRDGFDDLVRTHHAAVFRTARAVLRADDAAADVTQQVFLRVWRLGLGRDAEAAVDGAGPRLRWLASKLALNALRAQQRRQRREQETAAMRSDTTGTSLPTDEVGAVRAAIDALPEPHRAVVVLRYHEGLTLAAIGRALGRAESTAHARLGEALDLLRRRLREAGFAAAAMRVEHLAASATATSAAVPVGLQASLLAIPTAAVGAGAAKLATAAVLLLGGAVLTLVWSAEREVAAPVVGLAAASTTAVVAPGAVDTAVREGAIDRVAAEAAPGIAAPAPASAAAWPEAVVRGAIAALDGVPLAGVRVSAHCPELSGKAQPFAVATTTDAAGAFALSLPIRNAEGQRYHLTLQLTDWSGDFAQPWLQLRPGERRDGVRATMIKWASDVPGAWRGVAMVVDAAGRPVADVGVVVSRRLRGEDGSERLERECNGRSDAQGRVELVGDHRGHKLVQASPWNLPVVGAERRVWVDGEAAAPIELVLTADVPLPVRVVEARSGEPIARTFVAARRGDRDVAIGFTDDDGRALLRGLDGGRVSLHAAADTTWSAVMIDDVLPGGAAVEVRRKRLDDVDTSGPFGTEVHGVVVDAATGAPLCVAYGAVSILWLAADGHDTREDLLAERITPWPFQTCGMGDPPPPSPAFHLPLSQGGRIALVLRLPDRAVAVAGPFEVATGQQLRGIELRAEVGTRVAVRVVDAGGAPVPGAEVWLAAPTADADREGTERASELLRAAARGQRPRSGRGGDTDADGRCGFERVPTGLLLRAQAAAADGSSGSINVRPLDGAATEVTLTLRR